jgi:hypothetical protein
MGETHQVPQLLFASDCTSIAALGLVKIAVLLFYRRAFGVVKFRLIVHIMIGISIAWFLAFFIVC